MSVQPTPLLFPLTTTCVNLIYNQLLAVGAPEESRVGFIFYCMHEKIPSFSFKFTNSDGIDLLFNMNTCSIAAADNTDLEELPFKLSNFYSPYVKKQPIVPLNEENAGAAYDILADECGIGIDPAATRQHFISTLTSGLETCAQYTFTGTAGLIATFYNAGHSFFVACYTQDDIPEHRMMIEDANERLGRLYPKHIVACSKPHKLSRDMANQVYDCLELDCGAPEDDFDARSNFVQQLSDGCTEYAFTADGFTAIFCNKVNSFEVKANPKSRLTEQQKAMIYKANTNVKLLYTLHMLDHKDESTA